MRRAFKLSVLLIGTVYAAVDLEQSLNTAMADSLKSIDPRVMIEPPKGLNRGKAKHITYAASGGAFTDGYYYNTTRIEQGVQYYKYMWREACAFTKWTPSNQFVHAGLTYDAGTMTLERFGFIG